jgi:hypothetical protein
VIPASVDVTVREPIQEASIPEPRLRGSAIRQVIPQIAGELSLKPRAIQKIAMRAK